MAYVNVPKDLTRVKNKIAFNMTKRQLICLGIAVIMGIPFYFLTRNVLGTRGVENKCCHDRLGNETVRYIVILQWL